MKWPARTTLPIALKAVLFRLSGLCALLALALTGAAQTEGGLIGHWTLDENGQGNLLADSSPNELHIRLSAAAVKHSVDGKFGRAIRFPATGSIRFDRNAAALGKLSDFTVSMWIQYDGGASRQLFTFSDGTMSHRVQVEVHNDRLHFGWQNGSSFAGFGTENLKWTPGEWYHVVFVNDSKTGKSILRPTDLVWKTDANTLAPADLTSPVKRVEIGSLNGEYPYNGRIDDVRLFGSALSLSEQLAIYEASKGTPDDPEWTAAKTAMIDKQRRMEMARRARELFFGEEAPHLTQPELQQKTEWLFQTEEDDLLTRAEKEIVWTREMIDRLQKRNDALDLSGELIALKELGQAVSGDKIGSGATRIRKLYFDVRALKRRVMLQHPEIDFSGIICVDAPYPYRSLDTHGTFQQTEWVHESRFRSEMCA